MFKSSTILAFHQTSKNNYPGINNIRPGYFFEIIQLCREWGCNPWQNERDDSGPLAGKTVVITFDDGYEDNFDVLARLCDEGVSPWLFVPVDFIGKNNDWEYNSGLFPARHLDEGRLRELADMGVIVGSHGVSHRSLTTMNPTRLKGELADSKHRLEDITGRAVKGLSFPFGRSNKRVNAALRDCGYKLAFGLGEEGQPDDLVWPRTAIYGIDDYYSLKGKILRRSNLELFKNRVINNLAAGTIIVSKRIN